MFIVTYSAFVYRAVMAAIVSLSTLVVVSVHRLPFAGYGKGLQSRFLINRAPYVLMVLSILSFTLISCTRESEVNATPQEVPNDVVQNQNIDQRRAELVAPMVNPAIHPKQDSQPIVTLDESRMRHGRQPTVMNESEVLPEVSETDGQGVIRRTILVKRAGKYPLIRRETIVRPSVGGKATTRTDEMVGDHILVTLRPGSDSAAFIAAVTAKGYSVRRQLRGTEAYLVAFTPTSHTAMAIARADLAKIPTVVSSDADYLVHTQVEPNDLQFNKQWSLKNTGQGQLGGVAKADISAPQAWDRNTGSRNVKVAVIDTGIDLTHPDLLANLWTNPGETGTDAQGRDKAANGVDDDRNGYIDDSRGWNFYGDNNNANDDNLHGTHVAGTIGAVGNNGIGVSGVCWSVSLVPLKFLDKFGYGYDSDGIEAVVYATTVGVHVINASWGGGFYNQALANAIGNAGQRGILFVASAGNDGYNIDVFPSYPAAYAESNIIAVAATDRTDHRPSFSNFGPATVVIAAPGVDVLSTMPHVATETMVSEGFAAGYGELSGTSMAAPHVAGALALLKSAQPSYSAEQLRATLLARADHLSNLSGQVAGGARLNLGAMLDPAWTDVSRVALSGVALSDPTGNRDNEANPGEIVELLITANNQGSRWAENVTVSYTSTTTGVTVINGSATIANLPPVSQGQATSSVRLQLASTISDATQVSGTITLAWSGGSESFPYTFTVVGIFPQATRIVPFRTATPVADPVRNRVYLLDLLTPSILAIDTDLGRLVGRVLLDQGSSYWAAEPALAVSVDGSRLAVTLPGSQRIQEYALPGLTLLRTINSSNQPATSIAYGYNNRLCFTYYDATPFLGHPQGGGVSVIDPVTSAIIGLGMPVGTISYESGYITASADGTRLWHIDTQLLYGQTWVHEFALDGQPRYLRSSSQLFCSPMAVHDPVYNRLLLGAYDVVVLDLSSGLPYSFWSVPAEKRRGDSLATTASDPYLYSAWGTDVRQGIVRLRRNDGQYMGSIPTPIGWELPLHSLAETSNRRLFYIKSTDAYNANYPASLLGLVGASSLDVEIYPAARFTASSSVAAPQVVNFNGGLSVSRSGQALNSYQWSYGDGTTGSGAITSHTYASPGNYEVILTVRDGAGLPDRLTRTVTVDSTAIPATPIANEAAYSVMLGGQVNITLTGAGGTTFNIASQPTIGVLSGVLPNLTYSAPARVGDYYSADAFTFTVANGSAVSAPARVIILFSKGPPTAPIAESQSVTVASGVASPITLLATYQGLPMVNQQIEIISRPSHGRLSGNSSPLTYQSDDQYIGTDSFTYITKYNDQRSAIATVSISVVTGYALTDFGLNTYPQDINDSGVVVGYRYDGSSFTWKNGVFTNLSKLPGGFGVGAVAISNSGMIAGNSATSNYVHAVRWINGQISDLGGSPDQASQAFDINDSGVVVGSYNNRASRWVGTTRQTLDNPGSYPFSDSKAVSINALGVSGGDGQDINYVSTKRAYQWSNAPVATDVTPVGSLPDAQVIAVLNDGTLICNTGDYRYGERIYRIVGSTSTLIADGVAQGANNQGSVVGYRSIHQGDAFLWQNGTATNLNDLTPTVPGRRLTIAKAINVTGMIVGTFSESYSSGWGDHGFLLRPSVNRVPQITAGPSGPAVVTSTSAALNVVANDPDNAPQALTYEWSVLSGPGTVTFTPNAISAARNTTATFTAAGDYRVQVTVSDGAAMTSKELSITVDASLAGIQIRPASVIANIGDKVQFTNLAIDQFGLPLRELNTLTWAVSGGGSIDAYGYFQASTAGGPFTVTARSGAISGFSNLQVATALPYPWRHADFGNVASQGWATYNAGVFSIHSHTNGTFDNNHSVYQTQTGDSGITVRLTAANGQGRPLVFLRNAQEQQYETAPIASIIYDPSYGVIYVNARVQPGGEALNFPAIPVTLPCWLHMERRGGQIIGSYSQDGQVWTNCVNAVFPLADQITLGMGQVIGNDPVADFVRFDNARVGALQPPVALASAVSVPTNGTVGVTLTGRNEAGLPLTFRVVTGPAHGQVSGTAPALTYRPSAGYSGNDSFTFVANDGRTDSVPAMVSISVIGISPTITSHPANVTVTAGQTATFAVTASGSTPLAYQWKRGTTNVGTNSATLSITNAQSSNAGSYTCVVTNSAGTATSNAATLTVNTFPTVTWTSASQSSVSESGTLTVTAQLSAASGQSVSVPFTITGTATSVSDYTLTASPIIIAAGTTTGTARITITSDTLSEPSETVILTMGTPTNATLGATKIHTATITDDDAALAPTITSISPTSGATAGGTTVTLTGTNLTGTTTVTFGSTALWTPASIPTVTAWYDAADASTITASTSAVSQWRDKSGRSYHLAQVTGSLQPTTGATINSLNAIDFTGDAMTTSSNPFGATINNGFVISVYKVDAIVTGTLFSLSGSVSNRWQSHAPWSDGNLYFDCGGAAAPNRISAAYGVSAGSAALTSWYGSTSDNVQQVYKYGTLLVGDSSGHAVNTGGNLMVGSDGGNYQNATIGEFIVINGTVSAADRQKMEGYLAHKWGMTANLPAIHPYKSVAPSISGTVATSVTVVSATSVTCVTPAGAAGAAVAVAVTTPGGTATLSSAYTYLAPPTITTHPANTAVTAGQTATFTVVASGAAPLTYLWKRGTTNVGTNSATLSISNAQTVNAGSYTCVVTNSAGTATSNAATLTVNIPPTITSHPASVTVTAGQTATFTVVASGTAPLTYQWKQGTTNVGANSATLSMTNAQAVNAGSYTCVVTNTAGTATSNAATLTVNSTNPPLYQVGLRAEYFDFTTSLAVIPNLGVLVPNLVRTDAQIAYASVNTAWAGLPSTMADTFASRHSGWLKIDTAGTYTLFISSDDGSRVYLNGALVIDNEGLHAMQERSVTLSLAAGFHPLRVEFFENTGGCGLQFSWSGPAIAKQLVPASALWQSPSSSVVGVPLPWIAADVGPVKVAGSANGNGVDFSITGGGAVALGTTSSTNITDYTLCANEGQSFALPGLSDVAYGANGVFAFRSNLSGTVVFNNATFGDPIPGVAKKGYYRLSGAQDAFQMVYRPLTVNGELIARVVWMENTNAAARAGVMVRDSINSSSVNAFMAITPTSGAIFQSRTATGGVTASTVSAGIVAPYWVRVVRIGTTVTGWLSSDGITWIQVGAAVTLSLGATPIIGLGVTGGNNDLRALGIFDQVLFIPYAGG